MCHNDLLLANFLHDEKRKTVKIIDYEYLAQNPAAFDLANHFCEYAGTDEMDFSNLPSEDYKRWWLTKYLAEYYQKAMISEEEIDVWYKSIVAMEPLSHLFWGVWALMQAEIADIDFDYVSYGHQRLAEYFRLKDNILKQHPLHTVHS